MSARQSDLFGTCTLASPLIGFRVRLPDLCRCGAATAVVGAGKGPHAGELLCAVCDRHCGWLSRPVADWLTSIVNKFGAPDAPIVVRRGNIAPAENAGAPGIHTQTSEGGYPMVTKAEAFPSRFFKSSDVPVDGMPLKIAKVEQDKVGPEQELKWIVSFKDEERQFVLNSTNWDLIAAALRENDSDRWVGGTIELYATQTTFGKKMVDCIRVRRYRPTSPPAAEEMDDRVPF
jgi:hypothetical protein